MTKRLNIEITHREDYYGVKMNGMYGEVSSSEGRAIKKLLEAIGEILSDNTTFHIL